MLWPTVAARLTAATAKRTRRGMWWLVVMRVMVCSCGWWFAVCDPLAALSLGVLKDA